MMIGRWEKNATALKYSIKKIFFEKFESGESGRSQRRSQPRVASGLDQFGEKHIYSKWPVFLQTMHLCPHAGHWVDLPLRQPQYLHMGRSPLLQLRLNCSWPGWSPATACGWPLLGSARAASVATAVTVGAAWETGCICCNCCSNRCCICNNCCWNCCSISFWTCWNCKRICCSICSCTCSIFRSTCRCICSPICCWNRSCSEIAHCGACAWGASSGRSSWAARDSISWLVHSLL